MSRRPIAANPHARTLLAGMLAVALAGCGAKPSGVGAGLPESHGGVIPAPTPSGSPPPDGAAQAAAAVAAVARTQGTTRSWTAKAHSAVISPKGDVNWNLSSMRFRAPDVEAATVIDAAFDKSIGTKLVYRGGDTVDVKTYFFGFIAIKLTLPVTDSRLADVYKRTLKDTQTSQLMGVILDPKAKVTYNGVGKVAGEDVDIIDVQSPSSWKDVSHEIIGVSKRLGVPISRDVFNKANKRIFQLELEDMRVNAGVSDDDFRT